LKRASLERRKFGAAFDSDGMKVDYAIEPRQNVLILNGWSDLPVQTVVF
jgi:hypothetical protein